MITIAYVMLIILGIVIVIFILGAIFRVIKSIGR